MKKSKITNNNKLGSIFTIHAKDEEIKSLIYRALSNQ